MKNMSKKIVSIVMIVIMLSITGLSQAESDLDTQKQENNEKITEAQEQKEEVQEQKNQTIEEVNQLSEQITQYQSQIAELDSQIEEANKKIEEEEANLKKAQEDYDEQQDTLNTRIVALYEAGETSYLDVLLSSDSITDFISNYYIISEIAECDLELLEKIDNQKKEIEQAKVELEASKNELTSARSDKEKVSQELKTAKSEKDQYVAQLSQEEQNLQAQIDELREANVSIDQKIRERQKAIEEAKKKQEEEEKNNGNSNNSGSNNGSSSEPSNPSSAGFIYPVPSAYSRITTGLYYSNGSYHGAVDFGSGGISGQPIYAVADGYVVIAEALTTSYGNYIIIEHDNGLYTLYAHGQPGSITVKEGQRVKQGQQIMRVGNSGNSTGPHLHFEVRTSPGLYNNRVNPRKYLP